MCIKAPKTNPPAQIIDRSDAEVRREKDRRIQLGNQTGGRLATQLFLGNRAPSSSQILLGN